MNKCASGGFLRSATVNSAKEFRINMDSKLAFRIWSLGMGILLSTLVQAQSISPQAINNGGAHLANNTASVSFGVGELLVVTQQDLNGNTLGGGLAAGSSGSLAVESLDKVFTNCLVYPNPVSSALVIEWNELGSNEIKVELKDAIGRLILSEPLQLNQDQATLNLESLPSGHYILDVLTKEGNRVSTHRIIKDSK